MQIWVDADACPVALREMLVRAAERTRVPVCFVANQTLPLRRSPFVQQLCVPKGFDVADNEIACRVQAGDLVITQDIPLAFEVLEKGAEAINTRGERYSPDSIRARLNMRDFMETLRASGVQSGGPPPLGATELRQFASHLDRWLARAAKQKSDL